MCGCVGKFKQDESVSQSSEVCLISNSFNCYLILTLAYSHERKNIPHLESSVAELDSVMSGWRWIKSSKNPLDGQVDILTWCRLPVVSGCVGDTCLFWSRATVNTSAMAQTSGA